MIQKLSLLETCTTSNINVLKTFHVYSKKKQVKPFFFTKNSVKFVSKKESVFLGKKTFSLFVKPTMFFKKKDNSLISFFKNQTIPLKKKKVIMGSFLIGPCLYNDSFLKNKYKFIKTI